MKFGIADYGMMAWDGGNFDDEERLLKLKEIGYDGLEKLDAVSEANAINKAANWRKMGMDFGTCRGPNVESSIRWTAGLGKNYVWTDVREDNDFENFCRQVNIQNDICKRWGLDVAIHNHMGTLVETQEELESFLEKCPECKLVLDTAHLAAVGGDPEEIVRKYSERIEVIHLKDWILKNPDAEAWYEKGRFCELGAGNIGLDNIAVMKALVDVGYDDWIFIEHDTHLQDPVKDLKISREYLQDAGF